MGKDDPDPEDQRTMATDRAESFSLSAGRVKVSLALHATSFSQLAPADTRHNSTLIAFSWLFPEINRVITLCSLPDFNAELLRSSRGWREQVSEKFLSSLQENRMCTPLSPLAQSLVRAAAVGQLDRATGRAFYALSAEEVRKRSKRASAAYSTKEAPDIVVVMDRTGADNDPHITASVWVKGYPENSGYIAEASDLPTLLANKNVRALLAGRYTPRQYLDAVASEPFSFGLGWLYAFVFIATVAFVLWAIL